MIALYLTLIVYTSLQILLSDAFQLGNGFQKYNQVVGSVARKQESFVLYAKDASTRRPRKLKDKRKQVESSRTSGDSTSVISSASSFKPDFIPPADYKSKLPPIKGTAEDKQAEYNKKSIIDRFKEEYLTPVGPKEEPKLIQFMKVVTWGAVIVLVLIEIFVSIKVGGMPFGAPPDASTLPPRPDIQSILGEPYKQ